MYKPQIGQLDGISWIGILVQNLVSTKKDLDYTTNFHKITSLKVRRINSFFLYSHTSAFLPDSLVYRTMTIVFYIYFFILRQFIHSFHSQWCCSMSSSFSPSFEVNVKQFISKYFFFHFKVFSLSPHLLLFPFFWMWFDVKCQMTMEVFLLLNLVLLCIYIFFL